MLDVDLTSRDLAKLAGTTELMEREWAPCRDACPVHADVRRYLEYIAQGQWREAIDVIREKLPYAAVCGRVCHHPCEANCRRQDVDAAVAIREVKRFVAELQGATGSTVRKAASQDKAKVAVVGSGPAGLTAALDLAKLGYRPTVFEKYPIAGGVPATTIPKYRLPADAVQIDVDWICAHGVELVTGVEIGKDKTVEQLQADGFEAVLIATGLANSRTLPIAGADHPHVHSVMQFLTDLTFDRTPKVGKDVLVIGAGNVAMDAARSAVRMGVDRVRIICLENEEEMPAWEWESREAAEEGVKFINRRGPVEITIVGDAITGVRARKVTRVFDEQGGFSPTYDDADVIDVDCDTVIFAIGQMADMGFTEGSDLETGDRGRLSWQAATCQTNLPNVFACGEIVSPPGSAVEACASGQRAAAAIDQFLSGQAIALDDSTTARIGEIPSVTSKKVRPVERTHPPTDAPDQRKTNFTEFEHTLGATSAVCEARRCMGCGSGAEVIVDKCAACLTCLRVCPFDIPVVTDVARIASDKCQACGICIAECPANAIVAKGREIGDLTERTRQALAGENKIIAYIDGFHASPAQWRGEATSGMANVAELYLHSASRVSVPEILHALELGADGVVILCCEAGAERYPTTAGRADKRVAQVRQMLAEIGMDGERVQMGFITDNGDDAIGQALTAAVEKITGNQETQ